MAESTTQAPNGAPQPLSNDEPEKDPGTKTNYTISGDAQGNATRAGDPIPDTGKTHYDIKGD
jgi:hypothetical protein